LLLVKPLALQVLLLLPQLLLLLLAPAANCNSKWNQQMMMTSGLNC
jgi:hypothetical protein